jgi:hypothetical protein
VLNVVRFISVFCTALVMAPSLAHLLELPNKIALPVEPYYVVQQIYRGWALLGILIVLAILSTATSAVLQRRAPRAFRLTLAALACLLLAQVLYWSFTEPANRATASWTRVTPDFEALRARWEWSHAASALLNVSAVALLIASLLPGREPGAPVGRT